MANYKCTDGGIQPNSHTPTDITRAKVEAFVAAGFKQTQIAAYLGIHRETLAIHYRKELDQTIMNMAIPMSQVIYNAGIAGDWKAAEKWLNYRARWVMSRTEEEEDNSNKIVTLLEKLVDKV